MSTLNTALSNLKTEMATNMTTANGYNFDPTIVLGPPPSVIPSFPYISVWVEGEIQLEEMIGPKLKMAVPVILAGFTKGEQGENIQDNNNKLLEDILHYILNDCTLGLSEVDQTINYYRGNIERGDSYHIIEVIITLDIEYTKATIRD